MSIVFFSMTNKKGKPQKRKTVVSPDAVSETQPEKRKNRAMAEQLSPIATQIQGLSQLSPPLQQMPQMPVFQTPIPLQSPVQAYYTPQQQVNSANCANYQLQQQYVNQQQFQNASQQILQNTMDTLVQKVNGINARLNILDDLEKSIRSVDAKLTAIDSRVSHLENSVTESNKRLNDLEESKAFDIQSTEDIRSSLHDMKKQLTIERTSTDKLTLEVNALRKENSRLSEEALDLQTRSMRDNLLFFNIPECSSFEERKAENCINKIQKFCSEALKMENTENIKIDRAHRIGRYIPSKTRPIVAKLNYFQDKVNIKQRAYTELKDSAYRVADQLPREIKERRQVLYPVMQKAKQLGKRAVMSNDKLYVDGRQITADEVRVKGGPNEFSF